MSVRRLRISTVLTLIAGFVAVGILAWYSTWGQRLLCRNLSCFSIQNKQTFRPKEIYTDTPQTYRALFASGDQLIRIEAQRVPASEATKEREAYVARMQSMFTKAPAPYPGEVSDTVVCDPAFIPSYHTIPSENGSLEYFTGYLNNRLTFGSCSQNQAVYRGLMAFTYCASKSIFLRIELIWPAAAFVEETAVSTIQTLACR